jgi:peptide/nickel transport system permease protein
MSERKGPESEGSDPESIVLGLAPRSLRRTAAAPEVLRQEILRRLSASQIVWRELRGKRGARVGGLALVVLALVAVFAEFLAADLPIVCRLQGTTYVLPALTRPAALSGLDCVQIAAKRSGEGFQIDPVVCASPTLRLPESRLKTPFVDRHHPFGTDSEGRDVFARLVHGARTTLGVAVFAIAAFVIIGAMAGALAGFYGGIVDSIVSRVVEVLSAFPTLALALVVQAVVPGANGLTVLLTIALTRWTEVARVVRAEVLYASCQDYAMAARAIGASPLRILVVHVLPNVLVPAILASTFGVGGVVLIEASLEFLGVGAQASLPSWGGLLGEARDPLAVWWLVLFPGLLLSITLVALNLVGDAFRDALDPRTRKAADARQRG